MRPTRPVAALLCIAAVLGVVPAVAAGAGCDYPVTMEDATGTDVTLTEPPDRIVTAGASTDQTLWRIGAEDRVVGMWVGFSHLPHADDRTEVYGGSLTDALDDETVVGLSPDVVLASNVVTDAEIGELRSKGLTVYKFRKASDLAFLYDKTRTTGALSGHCSGADRAVRDMEDRVDVVERTLSYTDRPRVFYHMSPGLYTVGSDTFTGAALTKAGADNIAADAGISGWGQITEEQVVESDPEWILTTPYTSIPESLENTTAVQSDQTHEIPSRYLNQPAPILVDGIEELARTFYPQAFDLFDGQDDTAPGAGRQSVDLDRTDASLTVTLPDDRSERSVVSIAAEDVDLKLQFGPTASGDVTVARVSPVDVPALRSPGEPVTTWRIEPEDTVSVGTTELTFNVDPGRLDELGVAAEDLAVYHRLDGDWEALLTRSESTEEGVNVSAVTQEFSVFTVAATSDPVARITLPDDGVEAGETVTLDATASSTRYGAIRDVGWQVGDERYAGETANVTFEDTGTHEVALTVTTHAGLNATATTTVTVENAEQTDVAADEVAESPNGSTTDGSANESRQDTPGQPGFTAAAAIGALLTMLAAGRTAR